MGQSPDHEASHRRVHQRFTGLAYPLIVFAQPAVLPEPGEGPFHHPPSRQHGEGGARGGFDLRGDKDPPRGRLHDLRCPASVLLDPLLSLVLAVVGRIEPDMREAGKRRLDMGRRQ
jgi:hypothetical protein